MTQDEVAQVLGPRFDIQPETASIWKNTRRPLRVTCLACGMVFRPLLTPVGLNGVRYHNTVRDKRIVECG